MTKELLRKSVLAGIALGVFAFLVATLIYIVV